MSGMTGYLTSYGTDLSYVFVRGVNATTNSGYKLFGGDDLSSIFAPNTSLTYASNTGYLMINNQDITTIYEPLPIPIVNYNFIVPDASASLYFVTINLTTLLNGWTKTGGIHICYSTLSSWNKITMPSPYIQACAFQKSNASISQTIELQKLNYKLSFWIIGRNPSGYSTTTSLKITVNTIPILSDYYPSTTVWNNVVVPFFIPDATSYALIFKNINADTLLDSSFVITGIILTVA
jgi:hypothetical protein